jgi:hypothetical protein
MKQVLLQVVAACYWDHLTLPPLPGAKSDSVPFSTRLGGGFDIG